MGGGEEGGKWGGKRGMRGIRRKEEGREGGRRWKGNRNLKCFFT